MGGSNEPLMDWPVTSSAFKVPGSESGPDFFLLSYSSRNNLNIHFASESRHQISISRRKRDRMARPGKVTHLGPLEYTIPIQECFSMPRGAMPLGNPWMI